jgi:transcriptional regulator with XRE-family HTH domain
MSEDLKQIAARIRELRLIFGYSEEETAADLGIDADRYRSYESEGSDIPISVLYHLANKYKVDLTEILTGLTPRLNTFCVVPSGHGINVDRYPGYNIQSLSHRFMNKVMEPMLVTLEPSDHEPALVTHSGQEFNYVLDGSIYFLFEEKRLLLNKGDSVYFDPTHPHGQMAAGSQSASFLTVITE